MVNPLKVAGFLLLGLLICGCKSTTVTNLTPSQMIRNPSGLYPFEMAWESKQQSLRKNSLTPQVIIGTETYPMKPTAIVSNRWETLIPVPPDQKLVYYRFKIDYEYNSIPQPRANSKLSSPYRLEITDK